MAALGFIGLGVMGRPMASNLLAAGHSLKLYSRSGVPASLVEKGGVSCSSISEVAGGAQVVFVMVQDTSSVEDVLLGSEGLLTALVPGQIVVDCSSISPLTTKRLSEKVEEAGGQYLDAPVSGGEIGAKNADLSIMVGGSFATFERVHPLFEVLGKNVSYIGASGHGQIAKLANQIIVALNIEAVAEALIFSAKAGADPERVRKALMGGFASSRVLELHAKRMLQRSFEPGFRVSLHQKDLRLALDTALELGIPLPNTATAQQLFSSGRDNGISDKDHSSIVTVLETLAGIDLTSPNELIHQE